MHKQVVVVGSSNIDLIARLSHLPKPGETVGDAVFSKAHGGKGANQAVAAARAGAEVSFISSLGDDAFGHSMLQDFKRNGINTDYILQNKDTPTGTAFIWVDARGENSIAVAPGANYKLSAAYIDECKILLSGAELLLLQLEIPFETVEYVIELAAGLGKKIMLNPAPARPLERKHLKSLFNLTVNETEAAMLSGMPVETPAQVEVAGKSLLDMGPEMVVITLGARGVFYITKRERKMIEAYPVTPVDTTAAGDVFCGVLASQIVQHKKLADAIQYANAAAALSTTVLGAQPSAPNQQQIKDFMDQHEF